jgi:hypothetical protein
MCEAAGVFAELRLERSNSRIFDSLVALSSCESNHRGQSTVKRLDARQRHHFAAAMQLAGATWPNGRRLV